MGRKRAFIRGLLATTSVAALLVGGGAPSALAAACTNTIGAGFDNPSGHTLANVCVQNTSFTGNITNEGTISPSGIAFQNGTLGGSVQSTGVVAGGIALDGSSKIVAAGIGTKTGISVNFSNFSGGISNGGTISVAGTAAAVGVHVSGVPTFTGDIMNSGTLSAAGTLF